jgi:hypothetical protein
MSIPWSHVYSSVSSLFKHLFYIQTSHAFSLVSFQFPRLLTISASPVNSGVSCQLNRFLPVPESHANCVACCLFNRLMTIPESHVNRDLFRSSSDQFSSVQFTSSLIPCLPPGKIQIIRLSMFQLPSLDTSFLNRQWHLDRSFCQREKFPRLPVRISRHSGSRHPAVMGLAVPGAGVLWYVTFRLSP